MVRGTHKRVITTVTVIWQYNMTAIGRMFSGISACHYAMRRTATAILHYSMEQIINGCLCKHREWNCYLCIYKCQDARVYGDNNKT